MIKKIIIVFMILLFANNALSDVTHLPESVPGGEKGVNNFNWSDYRAIINSNNVELDTRITGNSSSLDTKANSSDLSQITPGTDPTKAAVAEVADTAIELSADFVDGESRIEFGNNTTRTPAVNENSIYMEAGVLKKSIGGVESDLSSGGSATVENTAFAPDWEGDLDGTSKDALFDKFTSLSTQFSVLQSAVAAFTSASDITDPVVALGVDGTHDGTDNFTVTADMVTEINLISITVQVDGGSVDTVTLPYDVALSGTSDITIDVVATDIAGNTGNDSVTLTYSAPAVALYTDNFDGDDGPLGANWTAVAGSVGETTVYSNMATSIDGAASIYNGVVADNQYAQITVTTTANAGAGPGVRLADGVDGYYIKITSVDFAIVRIDDGVDTPLETWTEGNTAGDIFRLDASGSILTATKNSVGQTPTVDDPTYATGGVGMVLGANRNVDDFVGGDL